MQIHGRFLTFTQTSKWIRFRHSVFRMGCIKNENLIIGLFLNNAVSSNGQSFWLQIQRSRVRFAALPDFMSSSGSGTGSTQPREVN